MSDDQPKIQQEDAVSTQNSMSLLCHFCKEQVSIQYCSNCMQITYCTKEHQKLDWKHHKLNCFPAKIVQSDVIGRRLIATRPILEGQIIIKENPLVSGPNGRSGLHPICLICMKKCDEFEICQICKWPLHYNCINEFGHLHANECEIFAKNAMKPFNLREVHMYEKVVLLRALLQKFVNSKNWTKIQDLASSKTERLKHRKGKLLSNAATEFIHKVCALNAEFSAEEIDHVLGVLSTNAYFTEDNLSNETIVPRSGSYLYYYASLPEHNCSPNCQWSIDMKSRYSLRAIRNISTDEPITQLYTQALVGTMDRRQKLWDNKYFWCTCERCSDSTENNTNFSTIKCPDCIPNQNGNLLPINPIDWTSDWKCLNCSSLKTVQVIETVCAKIRKDICSVRNDNSIEAIEHLERILLKNGIYVHSNHFLMHEIEQEILQRCSFLLASGKLTKKLELKYANRIIDLSKKSLNILERITPGNTTHRGRQLYFLQQGTCFVLNNKISKPVPITDQLKKEVDRFIQVREDAKKILEREPPSREEFLLAKSLEKNDQVENLKMLILK